MAFALVQEVTAGATGSLGTVAASFASVTAGELLVVHVNWGSTATVVSGVADGGNVYAPTTAVITDSTNTQSQRSYFAVASTTGAKTITVTFGGSVPNRGIHIQRWTGQAATSPFDVATGQFQSLAGTAADAITSGTVVPAVAGSLIIGFAQDTNGVVTPASGTGFTAGAANTISGAPTRTEYKTAPTTAAVAATFTVTTSTRTTCGVMVFKPAAGGGGGRVFGQSALDGLSIAGPKRFNPLHYTDREIDRLAQAEIRHLERMGARAA